MSNQYELHETAHYSGADNPIIYTREFDLEFKCFFDLIYFPFDTQICNIELKAGNKITNFIIYFKREHFKTAIPVSITTMLVMYTLNNSIAANLPQSSDIKFIDI